MRIHDTWGCSCSILHLQPKARRGCWKTSNWKPWWLDREGYSDEQDIHNQSLSHVYDNSVLQSLDLDSSQVVYLKFMYGISSRKWWKFYPRIWGYPTDRASLICLFVLNPATALRWQVFGFDTGTLWFWALALEIQQVPKGIGHRNLRS